MSPSDCDSGRLGAVHIEGAPAELKVRNAVSTGRSGESLHATVIPADPVTVRSEPAVTRAQVGASMIHGVLLSTGPCRLWIRKIRMLWISNCSCEM